MSHRGENRKLNLRTVCFSRKIPRCQNLALHDDGEMSGLLGGLKASLHHRVCARELAGASSADGGGNTGFASSFAASHPRLAWACQPSSGKRCKSLPAVFFQSFKLTRRRILSSAICPLWCFQLPKKSRHRAPHPYMPRLRGEISRQILNQTKSTRISS